MPWTMAQHKPLVFPHTLHLIPEYYLELLPRYNGEKEIIADKHLDAFHNYMEDLNVQFEDVYMRLFIQSLVGEPMRSFRSLPISSIYSWEMLEDWFDTTWPKTKDNSGLETKETNLIDKNSKDNVS